MLRSLRFPSLTLLARRLPALTLRARLSIAFVLLVILSGLSISLTTAFADLEFERQQAVEQLQTVAALKRASLETWVDQLEMTLDLMLSSPNRVADIETVLVEGAASPEYAGAYSHLQEDFGELLLGQTQLFDQVFLMDLRGVVVLSTDRAQEGTFKGSESYFREGLSTRHIYLWSNADSAQRVSIFIVHPFANSQGLTIGVLTGSANVKTLNQLMAEQPGVGKTSETYLIGPDGMMLTPSRFLPFSQTKGQKIESAGANAVREGHGDGFQLYTGYRGTPVVGVYQWLPRLQVGLMAEQDQAEAFESALHLLRLNLLVTSGVLLLAIAAAFLIVRSVTAPLAALAATATKIGQGDLELTARVEQRDEIGAVAQAFNGMTARLREIIGSLEENVAQLRQSQQEREQILQVLDKSEEHFRSVAETASEAIVSVNGQGQITFWNRAAAEIFGYPAREAIGRPLTTIMPESHRPRQQSMIDEALSSEYSTLIGKPLEWAGLRKNGQEFHMELLLSKLHTREGPFLTAMIRDIGPRKLAQQVRASYLKNLEHLSSAAEYFLQKRSYDEIYQFVAERLAGLASHPLVIVAESEAGTESHVVRAVAGDNGAMEQLSKVLGRDLIGSRIALPLQLRERMTRGRFVKAAQTEARIATGDGPSREIDLSAGLGMAGLFVAPLALEDQTWGSVLLLTPGASLPPEVGVMESIVAQATIALKREQIEQALRQARDELERRVEERTAELAKANQDLLSEIEERKRTQQSLQLERNKLKSILDAMADPVYILSPDHNIDYANPALEQEFGKVSGRKCYSVFHGRTEPCPWCRNEEVFAGSSLHWENYFDRVGKTFELFDTPLVNADGSLSKLQILHDVSERKRTEERIRELYQAEQRAHRIAETLRAASFAISRSLELNTVLDTLLDYLVRLAPYDTACVLLAEGESNLVVRSLRGYERWTDAEQMQAFRLEVDAYPVIQRIFNTRESILIPNTLLDPNWRSYPGGEYVQSWLGVPLVIGDNVIGVYSIEKAAAGFFTEEQQRLAEVLAAQAAIAVQNAWLFEQVRTGRERLQVLSRRLVEVQENERRYVARELHDEAGQALTSLIFGLTELEQETDSAGPLAPRVAALKQVTEGVLENLHRLAMDLRPSSLDHVGLVAALHEYVKTMGQRHKLTAQFKAIGFEELRLSQNLETALYRIVQEAFANVVRHARATQVDVLLERRDDQVVVVVEDNGVGFEAEPARWAERGRLGLLGIRERAEMLGGELTLESTPGVGTTLVVEVPYVNSRPDRG